MSFAVSFPTVQEIEAYRALAGVLINNPYWVKIYTRAKNPPSKDQCFASIMTIMMLSRELGLSPIQCALGGINDIEGKYEISARNMNLLLRRAGHVIKVKVCNDTLCTIWGKRADTGEEMEVTYHIEEARRAGLVREYGGWAKNPGDMVFARAISRLARRLTPDAIGMYYIEGELQEAVAKNPVQVEQLEDVSALKEDLIAVTDQQAPPLEPTLDLPEGYDKEKVMVFLKENADHSKMSVADMTLRASKNLEAFLRAYDAWLVQ